MSKGNRSQKMGNGMNFAVAVRCVTVRGVIGMADLANIIVDCMSSEDHSRKTANDVEFGIAVGCVRDALGRIIAETIVVVHVRLVALV